MKDLIIVALGVLIPGLLIYIFKLKRSDAKKDSAIDLLLGLTSKTAANKAAEVSEAKVTAANEKLLSDLELIEKTRLKDPSLSSVAQAKNIASELLSETQAFCQDSDPVDHAENLDENASDLIGIPNELKELLADQASSVKKLFEMKETKDETPINNSSGNPRSFFHK